jgi:hypothetical protein
MKKTFTLGVAMVLGLTFGGVLSFFGTVQAQCVPDPNATGSGIFPTPVTGVAPGTVGTPYSQVLTVNVPQDTTFDLSVFLPGAPTLVVSVNFLTIDNFGGLPPGLNYACNPGSCSIVGGNSGCVDISGIPTTSGQYVSNLGTTLNITIPQSVPFIGGTTQNAPGPLAYNFDISGTSSIDPGAGTSFTVEQNAPNPAIDFTRVAFHTTTQSDISLEVYSITGQRMSAVTRAYGAGDHSLEIDVRDLKAGVYFYTLSDGSDKVTRRLLVAR